MASGAVFPAFIRATYQETSDGVPAFARAMQTSVNQVRKEAELSFRELQSVMNGSLRSGKADLGVGDMRAAAAAADLRAQATRKLANAMAAASSAEADYSMSTQVAIAAARRMADEEENGARAAHLNVAALERLAQAAQRNNIAFDALATGNTGATRSVSAHRNAQMMLGQQLQDTAIQMQLGINPLMILTQQGSQAAFSLSQMGGKAAAVGRFLSSPWVAALAVAGTALSTLMMNAEDTAGALEKVKFSSDSVGDAQSILGNVMDITTGKISTQRQELIALAIAQTKVAAIQAQARAAALRGEIVALQAPTNEISGGIGGGFDIRRVDAGARGAISRALLAGEIDTKTAVQRLDNLRKAGALTNEAFAEAAKSMASWGVEIANAKIFEGAERLINGAGTHTDRGRLLKPTKPTKPSRSRASNDNDERRLYEDMMSARLQAQGNVGKLAAEMMERQFKLGEDQVTVGDQMIQQANDLEAIEDARAQGAQEMLELYLRQLDALEQMGSLAGDAAAMVSGIVNGGNFAGVGGRIGGMLRAVSPMVGEQGWKDVTSKLDEVFGGTSGDGTFSKSMTKLLQGAGAGQMGASLILGGANNQLGSSLGGAIGNKLGEKLLSKPMEDLFGKTLGSLAGPLGSIAGGLLGGALGGILGRKHYSGTAVVTGQDKADISVTGNKPGYRSNAKLAGGSIQTGLAAIADQLGADIGNYAVSIGQYDGKWRVNTNGYKGELNFDGKSAQGLHNFGKNGAEDAIKFAISDAVKDGALLGLRASTQALLQKSDDIEAQLQKAIDFEGVFTRLKEYRDPVGAALDTLDKEFGRLQKIFKEAGASAEEYASLEELYGIERAEAVKEAGEKITASLKSLFDELTVGNDARPLRERLAAAQANYSPLAQRVASGDITAYDDYSDAARTLLDIQRQISGSGEDYFKLLDQVTALTKTRIDAESNVSTNAAGRETIITRSAESMAPVVSATEQQTAILKNELGLQTGQLSAINENLIKLQRVMVAAGAPNLAGIAAAVRGNF